MPRSVVERSCDLPEQAKYLTGLIDAIGRCRSVREKLSILDKEPEVRKFCSKTFLPDLSEEEETAVKSLVVIGQYDAVFPEGGSCVRGPWIEELLLLERFYQEIGGIIGYHRMLIEFLSGSRRRFSVERTDYHAPVGYDLSEGGKEVDAAVFRAVDRMEEIAELYPVGGAADRLRLEDPETRESLPAALLPFNGKTMLARLIEDVQAREYLYFKIKGKQIRIPIAMMTSEEKDNHRKILKLCEDNDWFARGKDSFFFFCQPSVPAVDTRGRWVCTGPGKLLLKPGGHGVIWKLARDNGVFSWLKRLGKTKAVIRQINNPVSSEDYGLLAFTGIGLGEGKKFGFASCERRVGASEGINVVVEEKTEEGSSFALTNIEYCDFLVYGIEDAPVEPGSPYSKFPSNTNLLFADLQSVEQALETCPIPGILANFKPVTFRTELGEKREEVIGRLESTMQNIADCFFKTLSSEEGENRFLDLDAYITFNTRRKTISATKKEYVPGGNPLETSEGCFEDQLRNARDLLAEHCKMHLPPEPDDFVSPPFVFRYHPALGPLYSIIGKKIRGGSLAFGSELDLQIAECDIEDVHVEGSLRIVADRIMGRKDSDGVLIYGEKVGRCRLKNVQIVNQGIDRKASNVFSKGTIHRLETFSVFLEGESEFYAEGVTLSGDRDIFVEDGWRMIIFAKDGKPCYRKEKIFKTVPYWTYSFLPDQTLHVQKEL